MDHELINQLWTRAGGHCKSAHRLAAEAAIEFADRPNADKLVFNGPYSASIHLLVGFSFELALKTAFLLHGGETTRLANGKRGIGHNLTEALNAAEERGFRSSVTNLRWTIEQLAPSHQEHYFRYGGAENVDLPDLATSLPMLNMLVTEVGQLGLSRGVIASRWKQ